MRQVTLDTETTGFSAADGDKIVEIGCVEIVDRKITGRTYQQYINPRRASAAGALRVHGLTKDFLSDKPTFASIAEDFLKFIGDAEIIAHNASFDLGFLNAELREARLPGIKNPVTDTVSMAREKGRGRASLDALSKFYRVDDRDRTLHGALLDAEILADVYLAMTREQQGLSLDTPGGSDKPEQEWASRNYGPQFVVKPTAEELEEHKKFCTEHKLPSIF